MRKGAYSNKYKAIEAERLDGLKAERSNVLNYHKEKEKGLVRETNRRQRYIKQRKRSLANSEQKRRQLALEARRKKQIEATTKFQRQPIAKLKHDDTQDFPLPTDGIYNIRGHVVEIRDGIRVSPVRPQSNNQHMRNSSASERTKNGHSLKVQHDDSNVKNSIYSGREYLLSHLSDLSSGKDKTATRNQITNQSQIEGGNTTCNKAQNEENTTYKSVPSAPHEAGQNATGGWTNDRDNSTQPLGNGLSTIDSVEVGALQETQAKDVELKRKSSLKRRQPPGSPTKEKRKVKFNSSIEFNDGFIWLLKDSEEKARNGLIKNKVAAASTSVLTKRNLAVAGQNQSFIRNDSNRTKDYSYPETVDLGLSSKTVMGREDSEKYDVALKEQSKEHLKGDTCIEQIPDDCLFDSLEVDRDASIHNYDFDAVARDSLEISADEGEKQGLHVFTGHDSLVDHHLRTGLQGTEQYWHGRPSTHNNASKSKEIALEGGNAEIDEKFLGGLDSHSLLNTGSIVGTEPRMNTSGFISRAAGLQEGITHGIGSSHTTYEPSVKDGNTTVNSQCISHTATRDDSDQHHSSSHPSTASFGRQTDAEVPSRVNGTNTGYKYIASNKPLYSEPDSDKSASSKYNSAAIINTGGQPSFQDGSFGEQKPLPAGTLNSRTRQQQSSCNTPNFYPTSSTRALQDGYGYSNERQPVHARIKEDVDKSEAHRDHVDTLRSRIYVPKDQREILSSESAMLRTRANESEHFTVGNDSQSTKFNSLRNASAVSPGADLHAWEGSTTESHLNTRRNSVVSPARDTTLIRQSKLSSAESDNEDELIKKVRKSMAELQFSSNWRPESTGFPSQDQSTAFQDNAVEVVPRPTNKAKTLHAELVGDEDAIKVQSKLSENAEMKSNIPVRVKGSPTVDLSRQAKTVIAPSKAGIVPRPPKGPKGLFTRKSSRQSPHAQRTSPMRVIKPCGHANQGAQIVENLGVDGRLFTVGASTAATVHGGERGSDRTENANYQQRVGSTALKGNINLADNSPDNDNLNKTPTDDEINELWYNVRNCLTTKPPAKASSDSAYIAPPWKQNRTWSGTTRERSATNRLLSLHSAPTTRGYPLRRYGSQDNLIRRENSLDNIVESSSSRRRSANFTQRPSKAMISTNFQAFTARNSPVHKPYQSEKAPDMSKVKSNDMSESLASFIALEAMCQQESLSPHRTSAVLKASQNIYYQAQQEKINTAHQLASTRRYEPSALSIEERKIMESLEKLNTRLKEKESEIRKYEASSAWNQQLANTVFQETSRGATSSTNKTARNQSRGSVNDQQHPPYRF